MKLRINAKLRAALIAAISVVGYTITSAQAADITLANVMNQGIDADTAATTTVWGDTDSILSTVSAQYHITNGGQNPTQTNYTRSFLATKTNVGSNGQQGRYTYTLTFKTAETLANPVTLSSINVDFVTFNGGGVGHNQGGPDYNKINCTWTLTETAGGTLQSVELPDNGVATKNSAAYTRNADGTYTSAGFTGATANIDFEDFALAENTTYTLTLAVSKAAGADGFFVGIGNIALINTPLVVTSTWNGTEGHSTWSDSDAWSGTPFVDGCAAVFDGNATVKTATVNANVTADSVTVSGAEHTFNLSGGNLTTGKLTVGDGGSLELTGEGTVAASAIDASGKTITINEGVVLTGAGSGTLAGEGTFALASGSKSLGSISLGEAWNGYVRLSGVGFSNDNIDNLARIGASGVEMNGITGGYAANWNGGTVHADIRLTNPNGTNDNIAWKWSDGTTSDNATYPTVTFDGTWDGSGTFRLTEKRQCVTFSGDISGWNGAFDYSGQHGTKLTFTGNATTVNAAILNNGTNDASKEWKQFHLIVQNQATFNKAVGAYTLEIAASQSATFNGATNIANGVTMGDGATITVGGTGTLTLGGTVTFGGNAIVNNGTVAFGNNLVFNLDGLTPSEEEAGVHTYTLFSGSTTVNLTTLGVGNITLTGGTSGKVWSFSDHGTVSWTLPSELEWDNTTGNNKWSYSDANWHGSVFVENAAANFYQDATVEVSGNVAASAIAVGNGEAAANVTISAGEASTLTATTLQVDNGSLTTNVTIQGLGSNTLAAGTSWHIAADQTIAAGAIDGSVDVAQGKTVTLVQAATAKDLLLGITGEGNIALGTNVSFNSADDAAAASTKATGTLTLKEGVKLTVGNNKDKAASIASFGHVVMEQGAGIDTKSRLVEINNLTVNTAATSTDVIKMLDTYSKDEIGLNLKGTTTLNGNLEINSDWKYKVNIEQLAGTGSLKLTGGSEEHRAVIGDVAINSLTVTDKMTNVDLTGTVALSSVLGVNGTTNVTGQNAMTIGGLTGSAALNVANGITFNVAEGGNYSYTGTLTVGGQIVKQGDGTQTISGTALKHTVLAQAGTLVLSGDYAIDDIAESEIVNTTVDYEGNESDNGFHKSSGTITVYSGEGTLNLDAAHFKYANGDVTDDVKAGDGKFTLSEVTDKSIVYVTKDSLDIANYKTDALTSVELSDGTTVNMDTAITVGVKLAEGATATVNAAEATTITALTGTGTLNFIGDSVVTLATASTMTNAINIGAEDGSSTVTVKVNNGQALGAAANAITVYAGATLDINGKDAPAGSLYTITLAGGTLANTGSGVSYGSRQLSNHLIVSEDSTVDAAAADFGIINANYDPATIELNANLEKVGSHDFHICNATFSGDGKLIITDGTLTIDRADSKHNASTFANDIDMNGGKLGGYFKLADAITITATDEGSIINAQITNAGHTITFDGAVDMTVGGVISGEGGIIKDGEGTLTINGTQTYTGTTVVKGGRLVVDGSLADDNSISVEGDATIGGNVDTTLVGIASTKTATFEEGIVVQDQGLVFSEGVQVTNNAGVTAKYGIDNANMAVTADSLMVADESEVVVRNEVQLDDVTVGTFGSLTLDNVPEAQLELETMTIGAGAFVNVYTSDEHTTEATVVISDTLTAGGGTLLANLTLKDDSTLDLSIDGYVVALTLGSTLTVAPEGGLVTLDADTIAALEALDVNESLDLVSAAYQTELAYGGNYNDLWFGQLFERVPGVEGDYRVYATGDSFGLTKVSNTPEPTTGTLSLLALAALAARRRKHN